MFYKKSKVLEWMTRGCITSGVDRAGGESATKGTTMLLTAVVDAEEGEPHICLSNRASEAYGN